jgi:hypothetical protein
MANYIRAQQSTNNLPYLNKDWLFVDPLVILNTSFFKENIRKSLSKENQLIIDLPTYVDVSGSYPRFNLNSSVYNIVRNELNILPTTKTNLSFADITDMRANELLLKSRDYQNIYVFFSGGIDSTTILSAILKNWDSKDLERVVIVLNDNSINEYPFFYETYIKDKLLTVSTDTFYTGSTLLNENNMYVTGDCGSPIMHPDNIYDYEAIYPDTYLKSWKSNKDNIIGYLASVDAFELIQQSLPEHLDTVFDFFWWYNFNQGYDIDLYYLISLYGTLDPNVDTKQFLFNNQYIWFNNLNYQNWSMYSPSDMKIGKLSEVKLPMKQYILSFTGDMDYYNNKPIEFSVSKNKKLLKRIPVGIDSEYNIYYRDILDK